jgi:hypothetical protein
MFSCVLVARPVRKKSHHEEHEGREEPEGRPNAFSLAGLDLPALHVLHGVYLFLSGLFGDAAEDQF